VLTTVRSLGLLTLLTAGKGSQCAGPDPALESQISLPGTL